MFDCQPDRGFNAGPKFVAVRARGQEPESLPHGGLQNGQSASRPDSSVCMRLNVASLKPARL
jgi:hypothetical protein